MAGHALSAIQQCLNKNFKAVDLWSFDLGPTYIKPVSKYAFCFGSEPKERILHIDFTDYIFICMQGGGGDQSSVVMT
jgi:hypothetical protein